jgi:hypothetical protein
MKRDAFITPDGKYRYILTRDWSDGAPTKTVVFVGLNPSTADAEVDDPTIRRCIGFAKAWGFNRLVMVNLFAYRATDPTDMKRAEDPVGELNTTIVCAASHAADLTVAVWGTHGIFKHQGASYLEGLKEPHHLGLSKNGFPKHPLYLRADTQPQPFRR